MFNKKLKERIQQLENQVWQLTHPFKFSISDKVVVYYECYSVVDGKEVKSVRSDKRGIIVDKVYEHSKSEYSDSMYHYRYYKLMIGKDLFHANEYDNGVLISHLI